MNRKNLDKIPCASLLVRIFKAPVSPDGHMVLSKASVPEKDWHTTGVVIPTPSYGAGNYNTEMCLMTELEQTLFTLRQERVDQPVKIKALELMQAQGIQNPVIETLISSLVLIVFLERYRDIALD